MEREEVQGTANWSWSDIEKGRTDWLHDEKILDAVATLDRIRPPRVYQGKADDDLRLFGTSLGQSFEFGAAKISR